jgi:hypothetical protein
MPAAISAIAAILTSFTTIAGRTWGKTLLDAVNLRQMIESKIRKTPNKNMIAVLYNMGFLFG